MDILIRFWDEDNKKVDTRYFKSGIKELDKNNFLQISSDRPNINLKFLELMAENRETMWKIYESYESYVEIT